MKKEHRKDGEEPRDLDRVREEEGLGTGSDDEDRKVEHDWAASGTEDPAFFIKPSNGK